MRLFQKSHHRSVAGRRIKHGPERTPLTLLLTEAGTKTQIPAPETIIYHHDPNSEQPPETIIYHHDTIVPRAPHTTRYSAGVDTLSDAVSYEHNIRNSEKIPEVLILHEERPFDSNYIRKKQFSLPEIENVIVILDENLEKHNYQISNPISDPIEDAYFSEDEYESIRVENQEYRQKFKYNYEIGIIPKYIHKSSNKAKTYRPKIKIYDPHLHNLSSHSINPDAIATLPKRRESIKRVKNGHGQSRSKYSYVDDDSRFESTSAFKSTTIYSSGMLPTVTPKVKVEKENSGRSVPNLSPTDIMSSLFLQSLLVKALDQTLGNSPNNVMQMASTTMDEMKSSKVLNLLDTDTFSDAYRFRKHSEAKNIGGLRKASSIEKGDVERTEVSVDSLMNIRKTTVNDYEDLDKIETKETPTETTNILTTTISPLLDVIMRIVANSTIMISNDPMVLVLNDNSKEIHDSEKILTSLVDQEKITENLSIVDDSITMQKQDNLSIVEESLSDGMLGSENRLELIDFTEHKWNSTSHEMQVIPKRDTKDVKKIIENDLASDKNKSIISDVNKAIKEKRSDSILKNLEIHVHVHSPQSKQKGENYISPLLLKHPSVTRTTPFPRIRSLFSPKVAPFNTINPPSLIMNTNFKKGLDHTYYSKKPRLTFESIKPSQNHFLSTAQSFRYVKNRPFSTRAPRLLHHRINYEEYLKSRKNPSLPTGFRFKIPSTTTKSPIEYDIIVSQKPPIVDGKAVPTPNHSHISQQNNTNNHYNSHHNLMLNLPLRRMIKSSNVPITPSYKLYHSSLPYSPNMVHNLVSYAPAHTPDNTLVTVKNTPIPYRTFKPVQSINSRVPIFFSQTNFVEGDFSEFPTYRASTLSSPQHTQQISSIHRNLSRTMKNDYILSEKQAIKSSTSGRINSQSEVQPYSSLIEDSKGFVIPRHSGYFNGSVRSLSAFNSLTDMFASSYSLPLPIQPHREN